MSLAYENKRGRERVETRKERVRRVFTTVPGSHPRVFRFATTGIACTAQGRRTAHRTATRRDMMLDI